MKINFDKLVNNTYIGIKGNRYFIISKEEKKEKEITKQEYIKFENNGKLNLVNIYPLFLGNRGYTVLYKVDDNIEVNSNYVIDKINNLINEIQKKEPTIKLSLKKSKTTSSLYIEISSNYHKEVKNTAFRIADHETNKHMASHIVKGKDINIHNLRQELLKSIKSFKKRITLTLIDGVKYGNRS